MPLLEFVPVPGLTMAARLLLHIWDAVQEVDVGSSVPVHRTSLTPYIDKQAGFPPAHGTLCLCYHYFGP